MSIIKKYNIGYTATQTQFYIDCLKEMDCLLFVEKLLSEASQQGYDLGWDDQARMHLDSKEYYKQAE